MDPRTLRFTLCCFLAVVTPSACWRGSAGDAPRLGKVNERGRLELSRKYARRLMAEPEDAELWFRWGVVLLELGIPDGASNKFQKAVNLAPDDQLARQFLGHANYAAGDFGKAYEAYREVRSAGFPVEKVLAKTRRRIGEVRGSPRDAPGLRGIIELVAPGWREELADLVTELERLGGLRQPSPLAIDRVLLPRIIDRKAPAFEVPGRTLLDYCFETGRGMRFEGNEFSTLAAKDPAGLVMRLRRLAGSTLEDLTIEKTKLTIRFKGKELGGAPGYPGSPLSLLSPLNEALEGTGSASRFHQLAAPGERPLWILCLTARQFEFLKEVLFDSPDRLR